MGLLKMTGVAGQLRVANRIAAELGDWTMVPVEGSPGTKSIQASCVSVDRLLIAQDPDVLVLTVGGRSWRWHITGLEIGDGTLRGIVSGAPDVR